ncbi:EAL domain-containing protein [Aliamphritea hakodatensis]|uniref:EAL domain-containing protein n=1 Tax=Aliamphritea hakodatensis TaxID=2895352 RepID=UPI0022FD96B3|nr:EAL domain-containing protein [Aliamphritea hakodatensis]
MGLSTTLNIDYEEQLLRSLIAGDNLFPHFQPIVDLRNGETIGHEALIRGPEGSVLYSPDSLFQTAIRCGLLHTLELSCRRLSLQRFAELNIGGKLFLNISASLLGTPEHQKGLTADMLAALDIPQQAIVIELSEQHPFDQYGLTLEAVQHYRGMGFNIAIDDLGSGYSGLKLWSELQPNIVKIDKHFVHNVDREPIKRQFVKSICGIANGIGCSIIAEGIETQSELLTLKELGVTIGQGFYLGRPTQRPVDAPQEYAWLPKRPRGDLDPDMAETASVLVQPAPSLAQSDELQLASRLFRDNPAYNALAVLEDGRPVGTITRAKLLELFSTQYGRALYEQKPVSVMMDDALIIESDMSLENVSQMVTEQDAVYLNQGLVITRNGLYLGLGDVRDLLKKITELKIRNARYANPLTLLPGNVPISREIDSLLKRTDDFRVAYFDINYFKPFNDAYGYVKGDLLIQQLGSLLTRFASGDNFTGHVGGDDFVVVFRCEDWLSRCQSIIAEFDLSVREYYSPQDLEQGGVWSQGRSGESSFFPVLSLSVGVVHPDPYSCLSYHEVAELAAQAKKQAKKADGSYVFVSRRRRLSSAEGELARV